MYLSERHFRGKVSNCIRQIRSRNITVPNSCSGKISRLAQRHYVKMQNTPKLMHKTKEMKAESGDIIEAIN